MTLLIRHLTIAFTCRFASVNPPAVRRKSHLFENAELRQAGRGIIAASLAGDHGAVQRAVTLMDLFLVLPESGHQVLEYLRLVRFE